MGILLRTLSRNRVPSAYLFAGEAGIGKRYTALNFAKALNCLNPVTRYALRVTSKSKIQDPELQTQNSEPQTLNAELMDACDECASCKKIDAMTHPDLMAVAPEKGEIRVGEIRAVEVALSFKPFEGKRKVVIIDEADAMNQAAANAFLKTLEEPPDESLLILITAHPDMLPEPVRRPQGLFHQPEPGFFRCRGAGFPEAHRRPVPFADQRPQKPPLWKRPMRKILLLPAAPDLSREDPNDPAHQQPGEEHPEQDPKEKNQELWSHAPSLPRRLRSDKPALSRPSSLDRLGTNGRVEGLSMSGMHLDRRRFDRI